MKYTHIIWDFNGTVLDDLCVCIDSVNVLLEKRSIPKIDSVESYRRVFGFPIIKYYEKIGFDFSNEKFSDAAVEWVEEYMSRISTAVINKGVVDILNKIHKHNIKNILVSATELNMLKNQLSMLGISWLFDEVYGLDNIHAQNKIALAEFWRGNNSTAKALLVGDTDHDFETASAIKADCVLYSGGHQSEERLSLLGCPVIGELTELEKLIF